MAAKEAKLPDTPPPTYEEACLPGLVDPAPPLQPGYPTIFQVQGKSAGPNVLKLFTSVVYKFLIS